MDIKKMIIAIVAVVAIIAMAVGVSLINKDKDTDTTKFYTVSFNTNGGNEVVSQQVEEGKMVSKPVDPSKEGYEFLGWYLNGVYFDFETEVGKDFILEARWKEIIVDDNTDVEDETDNKEEENKDEQEEKEETKVTKYTVTFDSNGGSKVAKKTVEKNKTVKAPANPTRDGYKFLGWYLGSAKYNFSKKVTKNITLVAKWEKIEEEKPTVPNNPTEPEKPVEPDTPVTPEVKEYTVKFDVDGKVTTKTVKEGEKVAKPSNPTKDGYTFKYWTLNGTEYDFTKVVASNITLKAEWKKNDVVAYEEVAIENSVANQVKIYVTLNGKRVAGTVEMTSKSGKKVTVEVPATGVIKTKGTYSSISNPKVK